MHLYVAYYRNRTNLTEIIIILSRVCSALGSEPSSFSSVLIKNNRNNNSMHAHRLFLAFQPSHYDPVCHFYPACHSFLVTLGHRMLPGQ